MLWTWHPHGRQWISQTLQPGDEYELNDQARLWAIDLNRLLLFARPSVAVNGQLTLPLHPLADRDEITIGTALWCVSFDSMPERKVFRSTGDPLHCVRCCGPLMDGEVTIICPQCHTHYHDSEALPCWTYGPTCARCRRPTGREIWQPAPLHGSSRKLRHDHTATTR